MFTKKSPQTDNSAKTLLVPKIKLPECLSWRYSYEESPEAASTLKKSKILGSIPQTSKTGKKDKKRAAKTTARQKKTTKKVNLKEVKSPAKTAKMKKNKNKGGLGATKKKRKRLIKRNGGGGFLSTRSRHQKKVSEEKNHPKQKNKSRSRRRRLIDLGAISRASKSRSQASRRGGGSKRQNSSRSDGRYNFDSKFMNFSNLVLSGASGVKLKRRRVESSEDDPYCKRDFNQGIRALLKSSKHRFYA